METIAAVVQHFDSHRAAGQRVPDSFYEDLAQWEGTDEQIRTTYAWSGREDDGHLSVGRMGQGRCLSCLGCVLNEEQQVECFTTDQMLEHLDEHRTWGLFVADHVYNALKRDRTDNDQVIQNYFDERGVPRPPAPLWEPHSIFPTFDEAATRYDTLGQLAAILIIAIRRFVEPLSESERSAGWTEGCSENVVKDLRAIVRSLEAAHYDQEVDFRLMKDIERIRRRPYNEGITARFDQRTSALRYIAAFINFDLIGERRRHEWLTAAANCGRAVKGEEASGMKWIAIRDWDDLEDF